MKELLHTPTTCRNQLVLIAGNIIKAFSELLKNGKGDYYRNQEQMARAIELGKFLSSKKEIAAADDVRLFRIKEDIAIRVEIWQEEHISHSRFAGAKENRLLQKSSFQSKPNFFFRMSP
jgi:hypothetical protein